MNEQFLYLTTKGAVSGEPRHIEIWFVERAGRYYLVSEAREESKWVKNIAREPAVTFSVGTRGDHGSGLAPVRATARVVRPDDEPELARAVSDLMDKKYAWSDGLIVELTID